MKARIAIALFVLVLALVVIFLLLRVGPPVPSSPAQNVSGAEPARGAEASAPRPPEPVDLGEALALDRVADCARSPALASVLDQMVRVDPQTFESRRGGPINVPGHAQAIVPTFERTREIEGNADIRAVVADLDLQGRWHGLAVAGLRRSFYEESDVGAFQVRFAEPPERVREVLNRNGFRLPAVGELREIDEEGITTSLGIERTEGGAALTCTTG